MPLTSFTEDINRGPAASSRPANRVIGTWHRPDKQACQDDSGPDHRRLTTVIPSASHRRHQEQGPWSYAPSNHDLTAGLAQVFEQAGLPHPIG